MYVHMNQYSSFQWSPVDGSNDENESAEENDADYYRQEVGENPDPGMLEKY